jgi:hypothetical protein
VQLRMLRLNLRLKFLIQWLKLIPEFKIYRIF